MIHNILEKLKDKKDWGEKTLQFQGKFKLDPSIQLKEPLKFRCGFYSGVTQSERPLVVQDLEILPGDYEVKPAEKEFLLPEMAFLPDGYVEPQGVIQLSFDSSTLIFSFVWDDETSKMILEANTL